MRSHQGRRLLMAACSEGADAKSGERGRTENIHKAQQAEQKGKQNIKQMFAAAAAKKQKQQEDEDE